MKKLIHSLITIFIAFTLFTPYTVYANNPETETSPDSIAIQDIAADDTDNSTSSNILVEGIPSEITHKTELEYALQTNKKLFDIYGTWTSVITIILILITIVGFAVPLYNSKTIDKKIKKAISNLKSESEAITKKQLELTNALMLSASKEYGASNAILDRLIEKSPDDSYLHLLIARNIFQRFETITASSLDNNDVDSIERAIQHFLYVAYNTDIESEYYELGAVFPNSIVHELCYLTHTLVEYSITQRGHGHYHKLTTKVLRAVEHILNIQEFDDIANEDQTNVFIMNYVTLNHALAQSYMYFGNIKAKEQYEYTLKLYQISTTLDYSSEIEECRRAIKTLVQRQKGTNK